MKADNNTLIYFNYKRIDNPSIIVTIFPTDKSECLIGAVTMMALSTTTNTIVARAVTTAALSTNTNTNNNNTYFIKLSGISQGDPMEGFPKHFGGNRRK